MPLFEGIDWRVQASNIMPPVLRSGSLIDFISSLIFPLKYNSDQTAIFEDDTIEAARYNSQKIILQAALNRIFGVVSAPYIIVRTNSILIGVGYVFESTNVNVTYAHEQGGSTDYQLYAFESTFIGDDFNFTIKIPSAIYTAELDRQVTAQVNKYKLTGKTFNVTTY